MDDNKNLNGGYEYKPEPPKTNPQGYSNYNYSGGYQGVNNNGVNDNQEEKQQTSWTYGNSVGTTPLTPPPPPPKPPKEKKPPRAKGNAVGLKVFSVVVSALLLASVVMMGLNMSGGFKNDAGDSKADSGIDINVKDTPIADTASSSSDGKLSNQEVFKKASTSVVGILTYAQSGGVHQLYGAGSGVILSSDGYIVTNAHVVIIDDKNYPVSKIEVVLSNGENYTATLIGTDKKTDIGVLKINAPNLVAAEFGDSDKLEVGEQVFVIGNPDGLQFANSLTTGAVSGLNREVTTKTTGKPVKYIQTDATINPGNSGGALVNQYGQVVGIPVAKVVKSGFEGLGFAIPFNDAKPVVDSIIANGYVAGRPKIGITYAVMDKTFLELNGLPMGIRVIEVDENFDVFDQGLVPGDIITHMDGVEMAGSDALAGVLENKKPGDKIKLTVFHIDQSGTSGTREIEVLLGEEKAVE